MERERGEKARGQEREREGGREGVPLLCLPLSLSSLSNDLIAPSLILLGNEQSNVPVDCNSPGPVDVVSSFPRPRPLRIGGLGAPLGGVASEAAGRRHLSLHVRGGVGRLEEGRGLAHRGQRFLRRTHRGQRSEVTENIKHVDSFIYFPEFICIFSHFSLAGICF